MPVSGDLLNDFMLGQGFEEEPFSDFAGVPPLPGVIAYPPIRSAENFNELLGQ